VATYSVIKFVIVGKYSFPKAHEEFKNKARKHSWRRAVYKRMKMQVLEKFEK
jgi:hypothetical protein